MTRLSDALSQLADEGIPRGDAAIMRAARASLETGARPKAEAFRRRPMRLLAAAVIVVLTATAIAVFVTNDGKNAPSKVHGGPTPTIANTGPLPTTVPAVTTLPTTTAPMSVELSDASRLGFAGLGPISLGMDVDSALRAAGASFGPPTGCQQGLFYPDGTSVGISIWRNTDNTVQSIDVHTRFSTISGIHVGSTRDEVLSTYPAAHPYGEDPYPPEALEINDSQGRVIVFAFHNGLVSSMILAPDHDWPALQAKC